MDSFCDTAALDYKDNTELTFATSLAAVGDFAGLSQTFTVSISHFVPSGAGNKICVGDDCDWAFTNVDEASAGIKLSAYSVAGTVLAELAGADGPTDVPLPEQPIYTLVKSEPEYDLLEYDAATRQIKSLKSASQVGIDGSGLASDTSVLLTIRADSADGTSTEFLVAVEVNYCPTVHPFCQADRTESCAEVTNGESHYECICVPGFLGKLDCGRRDSKFNVGNDSTDDEQLTLEAAAAAAAADKKKTNSTVGIVIGLLVLLAVVVAIVLITRNRKMQNEKSFNEIRNARRPAVAGAAPASNFVEGQSNELYGWYNPQFDKQVAYEQLSTANPGNFIVRDAMVQGQPGYNIHFKTDRMVVRDGYISKTPDGLGVRLLSASDASPEPLFRDVPALVEHYGGLHDVNAPIQLNLDNPIYFDPAALGEGVGGTADIYNNAAVNNRAVDLDGPALPSKEINSESAL